MYCTLLRNSAFYGGVHSSDLTVCRHSLYKHRVINGADRLQCSWRTFHSCFQVSARALAMQGIASDVMVLPEDHLLHCGIARLLLECATYLLKYCRKKQRASCTVAGNRAGSRLPTALFCRWSRNESGMAITVAYFACAFNRSCDLIWILRFTSRDKKDKNITSDWKVNLISPCTDRTSKSHPFSAAKLPPWQDVGYPNPILCDETTYLCKLAVFIINVE